MCLYIYVVKYFWVHPCYTTIKLFPHGGNTVDAPMQWPTTTWPTPTVAEGKLLLATSAPYFLQNAKLPPCILR